MATRRDVGSVEVQITCNDDDHDFGQKVLSVDGRMMGWLCRKCGKVALHPEARRTGLLMTPRFAECIDADHALRRGSKTREGD